MSMFFLFIMLIFILQNLRCPLRAVKYIGADDTTLDLFESQYQIPNGVSYNSYVILDEKVAVMDTIDERKTDEWFANLENVLNGRTVDYLVISHLEPDHAEISNVRQKNSHRHSLY